MSHLTLDYTLHIADWRKHQFTVSLSIPSHEQQTLTLTMPSWIPGSYMVRDFARNVITLEAQQTENGSSVPVRKTDKQTWEVSTDGVATTVHYTVYANDLSVRSAFINHEYAFINGTCAFLSVEEYEHADYRLTIGKPSMPWKLNTTLPFNRESDNDWAFSAVKYEELIDHPIYIGIADLYSFDVDGVSFDLLFSGSNNIDLERIANDLKPICKHHMRLFGEPQPVEKYLFMTLLAVSGFGGLEHRASTALLFTRLDLPMVGDDKSFKSESYITFLSLCSHELFHTWHVKRIKPHVLVNPNLASETYTNQLWIYEGFTSFYDDVTLARVGLITPQQYTDIIAKTMTRLLQNEGRLKQSVAESSFDAWTKFYKQDASAVNNIVSYYAKGGIIALGLDLMLRKQSNNAVNLDDLMVLLWEHYGKEIKGTPDDVIQTLCMAHFQIDVSDYLNDVVYGTQDVSLSDDLPLIGLSMHTRAKTNADDKGGATSSSVVKKQLGATLKPVAQGLSVIQVFDGLAAMNAGILLNDVIIAVNHYVVDQKMLQRILDTTQDATVEVTLIRDGKLMSVQLTVTDAREDASFFTIDDVNAFEKWLSLN
ncbi:M61 family metallopeptidase [Alteromonas sp. A079]|uniref:M61 family metallopeptidase n=1 Tax=Alteromonas sp. A079 TaxID=3410268 RepID=UPI003B9E2CAB